MKRLIQLLLPLVPLGLSVPLINVRPAYAEVQNGGVEVMLAIDVSGSMKGAIGAAKVAASDFVESMPPEVSIGLETFADTVTVLTAPTMDRSLLAEQIASMRAGGDTALYDAVVTASNLFTPGASQKVLVVLSDGKDEGSKATLTDAIAGVQGVHVEAISLTTPETDLHSLSALGPVTSVDDAAGVAAAFARVSGLVVNVVETVTVPPTIPPTTTVPATTTTSPAPTTTQVPATTVFTLPPKPVVVAPAPSRSSTPLYLGGAGVFLALFVIALLCFPRQRVSKARLGIEKPRNVSEFGQRTMSAVEEVLERHGKRAELATTLAVADISMNPGEFVAMTLVVAMVFGLVGLFVAGPLVGAAAGVVVCLAVRFYVRRRKSKRQTAFADQMPEVLQLITTALRSGFGITQAIESVGEDAEEPARSEFAHVLVETRLGRDLSESLRALARRMESVDLEWVVSAIDINRETGGNLSEILNTVSATIRERRRIARHVRTLTAEGRLSARILTILPLTMMAWQWRVNGDSFSLLFHGAGLVALIVAGILMALGAAWVRRIVNSVVL